MLDAIRNDLHESCERVGMRLLVEEVVLGRHSARTLWQHRLRRGDARGYELLRHDGAEVPPQSVQNQHTQRTTRTVAVCRSTDCAELASRRRARARQASGGAASRAPFTRRVPTDPDSGTESFVRLCNPYR